MAKLYYGNGECTIEGVNILGVEIRYSGNIRIEKSCGNNFILAHKNKGILIFPNIEIPMLDRGGLNDLFKYIGSLKILSLIVSDNNGDRVSCLPKRVMDYSELLDSTAETMTVNAEDLSSGYSSSKYKIEEIPQIIENLHTRDKDTPFYLKDDSIYKGSYHVHFADSSAMTGSVHDASSQDLYFKQVKFGEIINKLIPTRNPSHKPSGLNLRKKRTREGIYRKEKSLKSISTKSKLGLE